MEFDRNHAISISKNSLLVILLRHIERLIQIKLGFPNRGKLKWNLNESTWDKLKIGVPKHSRSSCNQGFIWINFGIPLKILSDT